MENTFNSMKPDQQELYEMTMKYYGEKIGELHSSMVAPLIAVRQIVQKTMKLYKSEHISQQDFKIVCDFIFERHINNS